jgi:hypothetical protein
MLVLLKCLPDTPNIQSGWEIGCNSRHSLPYPNPTLDLPNAMQLFRLILPSASERLAYPRPVVYQGHALPLGW